MKQIIINGKFLSQKITGVQRVAREILVSLDQICNKGEIVLVCPCNSSEVPVLRNIELVYLGRTKGIFWEQITYPVYVAKQKGVTLNLCNVLPFLLKGYVVLHDVKVRAHPEFFSFFFRLWYRLILNHISSCSDIIFTNSFFSASEIVKYYPEIRPERIIPIPLGWQHIMRVPSDNGTLQRYGLKSKEFIFSVFSMDPNKNVKWILESAAINTGELFVIAGGNNDKVFQKTANRNVPDNVRFIGYVSEQELKCLYKECKAFVFPSFYEGFGLPPLEALSAGASHLIVSDTEVMHELFGSSVIFINPNYYSYDISQMLEKDRNGRKDAVLSKYSWIAAAKLIYNEVLKNEQKN